MAKKPTTTQNPFASLVGRYNEQLKEFLYAPRDKKLENYIDMFEQKTNIKREQVSSGACSVVHVVFRPPMP